MPHTEGFKAVAPSSLGWQGFCFCLEGMVYIDAAVPNGDLLSQAMQQRTYSLEKWHCLGTHFLFRNLETLFFFVKSEGLRIFDFFWKQSLVCKNVQGFIDWVCTGKNGSYKDFPPINEYDRFMGG
jgi:hypothetical protein